MEDNKQEQEVKEEVKKEEPKKNTTRKRATKKVEEKKEMTISDIPEELLAQIVAMAQASMQKPVENIEEEKKEPIIKRGKKVTKADLHKIRDEEVILKSVTGSCTFKSSKTNTMYRWVDENDEETMTVAEIINMEGNSKKFLHSPWVVMIEDFNNGETIKAIIEAFGLEVVYDTIFDLDELLEKDLCDIEQVIGNATNEYKEILANRIYKKIINEELRDVILIRELERMLGKSFM